MPPALFPDEKPFFLMRSGWSLDIARTLILHFSSEFQHDRTDNFFKVEVISFLRLGCLGLFFVCQCV